jgi:hypothetical protein
MNRLNADPDWVRRQQERDEQLKKAQAELRRAEMPVINALAEVGIVVNRLWDLQSFEEPYPEAIPILLEHMRKPYRGEVLERIGRALAVPETRHLWPTLVELYKVATDPHAKDGLALALREHAFKDKQLLDEIIALIKDPSNGPSRVLLVAVLSRSRQPHAKEVLYELRDDPDLYKEIAVRLKQFERNAKRRKKS